MNVTLLFCSDEKLIEQGGRLCYDSFKRQTPHSFQEFIKKLIKMGHTGVLEHCSATFLIEGISRACSHQLVRHRLASYSQRSQRYVAEDGFEFVIPPAIEKKALAKSTYLKLMEEIKTGYKKLRGLGIKNEDARFILPNACATKIQMTANFREWRHFLKQRLASQAQWEIRELASRIKTILKEKAPHSFFDF